MLMFFCSWYNHFFRKLAVSTHCCTNDVLFVFMFYADGMLGQTNISLI